MSNDLTLARPHAGPGACSRRHAPAWRDRQIDEEFSAMTRAFRSTGGICHGDDIARRLSRYAEQPISIVARWIVNNEALAFAWNHQMMLPLFQFEACSMTLRPGVSVILRELSDVFDNWGCALWFAQSNAWLADRPPVDLMETGGREVLDAARLDRFIARG
ncbi:hypothetical protein [Variovorax sp. GT1P44]|uniref:hypothetical protein n=1 Tax=Variovorax sp. GT1P44 TaxID=3443742 RepID=UPI003F46D191